MLTIEDLPDEVLELVFLKLSLPERKLVRLVNKHWLAVCNCASITQQELIKVKFKNLHQLKIPRVILNLSISYQKESLTFHYKHRYYYPYPQEFWISHGDSVRYLSLDRFYLEYPILSKITNHCPKMTELSLSFVTFGSNSFCDVDDYDEDDDDDDDKGISDDLASAIECPVNLTIYGGSGSFIATPQIVKLTKNVPNLRRLAVYSRSPRGEGNSFKHIISLVKKQAFTLKEFAIKGLIFTTDIKESCIEEVCELLGPQLTGLHFISNSFHHINWFYKFADKFHNLENFELTGCYNPEDIFLSKILKFKNLKYISLNKANFVVNDPIPSDALENLCGLDIGSTTCNLPDILKCIEHKIYPNLIALRLEDFDGSVTDDVLAIMLPLFPNLKFLNLSDNRKLTTNAFIEIVTNCRELTHLVLRSCLGIQNIIEPLNINYLTKLVHLNLAFCRGLDTENISQLYLSNLKTIHLGAIPLTENGLQELVKNCPKLKRVYLNSFHQANLADCNVVRENSTFTFDITFDFTIFNYATQ